MIRLTQSPQPADFEHRIMPHLDAAYSLARFLMPSDQEAEDVVQESCLRAFRFYKTFSGENSRAWFLKIVRNTSFTALQRARTNEADVVFDEEFHSPESQIDVGVQLDRDWARQIVRAAIEELPAEFREAITLRELEGCSYKEIADIANVPAGTVMSQLAR